MKERVYCELTIDDVRTCLAALRNERDEFMEHARASEARGFTEISRWFAAKAKKFETVADRFRYILELYERRD